MFFWNIQGAVVRPARVPAIVLHMAHFAVRSRLLARGRESGNQQGAVDLNLRSRERIIHLYCKKRNGLRWRFTTQVFL
jgi:hypothetical protein